MTILWAGGEDIDFPNGSPPVVQTGIYYRPTYARCGLDCSAQPSSSRSLSFVGGAVTSAWLHFQLGVLAGTNGRMLAGLGLNSAGNGGLFVGTANANTAKCALFTWDGTTITQIATEAGTSYTGSGVQSVDMQVTNFGASSIVNVYVNNVLVIAYAGSTTISGIASLDCVSLFTSGGNYWISECIVGTVDTRSMSLLTMAPNAAGDVNNWTTGTYANINPVTINDASVIAVNTTAQDFQANLIDLPAGTFSVNAVKAIARAEITAGSVPTSLKIGVKTGGTVNVDAGRALNAGFLPYERLMGINPVTAAGWLASDMNALQMDLQSA
jgi:hypothetical protein